MDWAHALYGCHYSGCTPPYPAPLKPAAHRGAANWDGIDTGNAAIAAPSTVMFTRQAENNIYRDT